MGVQHAVHQTLRLGVVEASHCDGPLRRASRPSRPGLPFRLKENTRDYYFKRDEIAAVRHKKAVDGMHYVVAKDNFSVTFTGYTFFQPKKLATRIAARVGQTIQEDKP
jgi:hypothetical protein